MTDRDSISEALLLVCWAKNKQAHREVIRLDERDKSITVLNENSDPGPKYMFTDEGELKSIIRGGNSYGPDGKKVLR